MREKERDIVKNGKAENIISVNKKEIFIPPSYIFFFIIIFILCKETY